MEKVSEPKGWLWLPALWGGILCCLCTLFFAHRVMVDTGGLFVYPLDDSYIHLALARTLTTYHVWGIGPAEFGSASSSPGWTLLLAASNLAFGPRLLTPIVLNLLMAFCLLFFADYAIKVFVRKASLRLRYAIILVLVVATPLPDLAFIGMEHVAQTLSVMLVAVFAVQILTQEPSAQVERRTVVFLMLSAAFAGAIRYEAVFIVLPVGILLLVRGRLLLAVMLALSSALGPAAFGLYSHHLSGFWLPFSVLAKAGFPQDPLSFRHKFVVLLGRYSIPVLVPMLVLWIMRVRRRSFWDPIALFLMLTSVVAAAHMIFAPMGWLMRYESYFVFLSIFAIITAIAGMYQSTSDWVRLARTSTFDTGLRALLVLWLLILGLSLGKRTVNGIRWPIQAAVDRFHEHLPMANFIHDFYNKETVVVNDIGAVAYYTDAHLLDMAGLGSDEPLLSRRQGVVFGKEQMAQWANEKHASIAVLQPNWTVDRQRTPSTWILVQMWQFPRNIIFDDRTIGFYAVTPDQISRLCDNLTKFSLPDGDRITFNRCNALVAK